MAFLDFITGPVATLASGFLGYQGQKDANAQNIALGREQMQFQERMANTSWQRGVEDMKKAGLNPMLAYSQGGASAPVGSMPQVQNAVGAGSASASQAAQTMAGLQALQMNKAQIAQTEAMTKKIESETMERNLNTAQLVANVNLAEQRQVEVGSNVAKLQQETRRVAADIPGVEAESASKGETLAAMKNGGFAADVARRKAEATLAQLDIPKSKSEADFYEKMGKLNPQISQILMLIKALTGISSAAGAFSRVHVPK